jgi:acetyl esterase/lipase
MAATFADAELADYVGQPQQQPVELDVRKMREGGRRRARLRARGPELAAVGAVRIGAMAARLYRPGLGPVPLVVFAHGGGWTIGDLDTHDRVCRRLAHGSGAAVLALDYRLAPEHPWPAAVDDVVDALRWVATSPSELGAITVVAVAGDSAGGALATLSCLRLRVEHPAALPDLQVLICPNTDLTGSQPSMREKGSGFGLTADGVRFFSSQWVPDRSRWADPGVSPLFAPDLSGIPPALVVTAEHDPLRDEGEAYAARLAEAGVAVELRREPGLIHGFVMMDEVSPSCEAAADRIAADLRAATQRNHDRSACDLGLANAANRRTR